EGNGILFKPEDIGPVELATTSFGQGVSVTPIQQVMAVAASINGGYLYEPYIAKEWIDPLTGDVVQQTDPILKRKVISKKTSSEVAKALESVVAEGTGRPAYVDGYRVGGKTGTAQKVGKDGRYMTDNYIVSFIGFAPADDPEIVVYVAIDHSQNTVQFGGVVAAPIEIGRSHVSTPVPLRARMTSSSRQTAPAAISCPIFLLCAVAFSPAIHALSLHDALPISAQKVGKDGRYMTDNYIVSFIGFAPADDPEIVVYVAIDHPQNTVQFGGVVAAPIVGTIIEDSLSVMGVERRSDGIKKDYVYPEQPKIEVPDLVGLQQGDLMEYMTNLSVETNGSGKYIIDQAPPPGAMVEQGATIRVYLSDKK